MSQLNEMKIKFAVIGCGHIGKKHSQMIYENPCAKLVALVDLKPKSELGIDEFNVPFFNSLEDFLNSEIEVDVINIATPNGFHANQAILSLNNKKHVVIEKPMALNTLDAKKIIEASKKNNKKVFCVMQNRYSPPSKWLKNLVESKKLGKIYIVKVDCFWNRDERYYTPNSWHGDLKLDGGTLFTQFSHFIDLIYWIFGDFKNISARFNNFNHQNLTHFEDSGNVFFEFFNGGFGTLNYSTSVFNKNFESSITIIAENGSIKVGGQYMDKVEYCHVNDYKMPKLKPTNPGNDYGYYKGSAQNHNFLIQNVIDVFLKNKSITVDMMEGCKVVEIIEKIYSNKKN